jgi:hypothetical protein
MAVYTARAMLHGKGHDVWEMMVEKSHDALRASAQHVSHHLIVPLRPSKAWYP